MTINVERSYILLRLDDSRNMLDAFFKFALDILDNSIEGMCKRKFSFGGLDSLLEIFLS